jgi:hypothetical protein
VPFAGWLARLFPKMAADAHPRERVRMPVA